VWTALVAVLIPSDEIKFIQIPANKTHRLKLLKSGHGSHCIIKEKHLEEEALVW